MIKNSICTLLLFLLFLLAACKKEIKCNDLELFILNENITSYSKKSNKDTISVVSYRLVNNSKRTYFINNLTQQSNLSKTAVFCNGLNLNIYKMKGIEVKYLNKRYRFGDTLTANYVNSMIENFAADQAKLGNMNGSKYFGLYERSNIFFIHPNETIYFEYTINLKNPTHTDKVRQGFVNLDSDEEYYATLSIASDSSNYRNVLPRDILNTIRANNAKVYHGIIKSKNKTQIKVID